MVSILFSFQYFVHSVGASVLESMADTCMELTTIKRQNGDQLEFKGVLERLRTGDTTTEDAAYLMRLHMSNYSQKEAETITTSGVTMHLFATKAPRNEHNFKCLADISSSTNPVALLKAQWSSSKSIEKATITNHFKSPPASATIITRGAIVRIVDQNFEPHWGLYNNAIGKVDEIVFKPGQDPNNGDLPSYVAVSFDEQETVDRASSLRGSVRIDRAS